MRWYEKRVERTHIWSIILIRTFFYPFWRAGRKALSWCWSTGGQTTRTDCACILYNHGGSTVQLAVSILRYLKLKETRAQSGSFLSLLCKPTMMASPSPGYFAFCRMKERTSWVWPWSSKWDFYPGTSGVGQTGVWTSCYWKSGKQWICLWWKHCLRTVRWLQIKPVWKSWIWLSKHIKMFWFIL